MESIYTLFKKNHLRVTPQRKAILEILCNCEGHHPDAENIYQLLHAKGGEGMKAGLATVYRTLDLFERIGLVARLSMENEPSRFELVADDKNKHHHLICLGCGQVEEMDDEWINDLKDNILQDKGFLVADKPIKIYGYCSRCRKKKEDAENVG